MIKTGDKVICINNKGDYLDLTEGKEYFVLYVLGHMLCIEDDHYVNDYYEEKFFMLYNDWIALNRENHIKSILDD
jgi:hypothetical protein